MMHLLFAVGAAMAQDGAPAAEAQALGWSDKAMNIVQTHGPNVVAGLVIIFVTWIVSKWVQRLILRAIERAKVDLALGRFLASIGRYTVLLAGGLAALQRMGIEATSLTAIFASAGLAVGLALQGSLGNFASGVMLLFFRPFELGDVVNAGGVTGLVEDIGIFATTLMTPSNEKMIVPNGAITAGNITNFTTMGTRRAAIDFGVAYGEDLEKVQKVVLDAISKLDIVHKEPAPAVAFTEMAASSLNFAAICWADSGDYLGMQHQVRSAIYNALNEANIDIPFDQVVVHQAPAE